jgi:hypothetical protein
MKHNLNQLKNYGRSPLLKKKHLGTKTCGTKSIKAKTPQAIQLTVKEISLTLKNPLLIQILNLNYNHRHRRTKLLLRKVGKSLPQESRDQTRLMKQELA